MARLLLPATVVLVLFGLIAPVLLPLVTRLDLVVVEGSSPRPALHRGDVVVTRPWTGDELRPGRIVVVDTEDGHYLHRVAAVGDERLRLAGGGGGTSDGPATPEWVQIDDVVAIQVTTITGPNAALVRVVSGRIGATLLLVVLLVLLVGASLRPRDKRG